MLECIFSVPSEIDRKGAEKHMEGPPQQAFEFDYFSAPFGLRIRLNSWALMGLALIALAAFFFLLCSFTIVGCLQSGVVQNHQRLAIENQEKNK